MINVSCSRTQRSDAGETRTCGPSVLSHTLYHWTTAHFSCFFVVCICRFFKINFLEKFLQEYRQSVKQFASRLGPTFCWAWFWVETVCKGYQRMTLDGKELEFFNFFPALTFANSLDPDQDRTKYQAWAGLFETMMVSAKIFFSGQKIARKEF